MRVSKFEALLLVFMFMSIFFNMKYRIRNQCIKKNPNIKDYSYLVRFTKCAIPLFVIVVALITFGNDVRTIESFEKAFLFMLYVPWIFFVLRTKYYDIRFRGKTFIVCNETTGELGNEEGIGNLVFTYDKVTFCEKISVEGAFEDNIYYCEDISIFSGPYTFIVDKKNKVYQITSEQFEGIAWYSEPDGYKKFRKE